MEYGHLLLAKILELHLELQNDGKDIIFIGVPGHVGIREILLQILLQRMPLRRYLR